MMWSRAGRLAVAGLLVVGMLVPVSLAAAGVEPAAGGTSIPSPAPVSRGPALTMRPRDGARTAMVDCCASCWPSSSISTQLKFYDQFLEEVVLVRAFGGVFCDSPIAGMQVRVIAVDRSPDFGESFDGRTPWGYATDGRFGLLGGVDDVR